MKHRFVIREKHVMNSLLDMLVQDASYQMKNPGLRSTTADGKLHGIFLKTLFKHGRLYRTPYFLQILQMSPILDKNHVYSTYLSYYLRFF